MATPLVDITDPREMQLFSAACVLAKHLQYAYGEAFFHNLPVDSTPVSLWGHTRGGIKELWIRRAMDWLRSQDPVQRPGRTVEKADDRADNVIAFITPKDSA